MEPIKGTWKQKGVSICSDRWADAQRRPIIIFIAVTESDTIFLNSVNVEGEVKKQALPCDEAWRLHQVGAQNVIQIITDNASACKAASAIVKRKYPHIFWTPYVVHTLNLALKNICAGKNTKANVVTYEQYSWITKISNDALIIKNFIMNYSMRLVIFNDYSKMNLLAIAETKFAS